MTIAILAILLLGMANITDVVEAYSVVDDVDDLREYSPEETTPDVEVPQEVIDRIMSLRDRIDIVAISSEIGDGAAVVRIRFNGPAISIADMEEFLAEEIHLSIGGHVWYKYGDTQVGFKFEVTTNHVTDEIDTMTIVKSPVIPVYEEEVDGGVSINGDEIAFIIPLVDDIDWAEVVEYTQDDGSQIVVGVSAQLSYYYEPQLAKKKILEDLVIIRAAELGGEPDTETDTGIDGEEPGEGAGEPAEDNASEPEPPIQQEPPRGDGEVPSEEPGVEGGGMDPALLLGIGAVVVAAALILWLKFLRGGA